MKVTTRILLGICLFACTYHLRAQEQDHVSAIKPPATPLPDEADSRGVTKFCFIV